MYISIDTMKLTEKEQNILLVLDEVIRHEVLSTIELARQTGLSASTISRVLSLLFSRGLLLDLGREETRKGRYPRLIGINKRYGLLMHFSIHHDIVEGYLSDLECKILLRSKRSIQNNNSLEQILGSIHAIYKEFLCHANNAGIAILAVSICLPGTVNRQKKIIQHIPDIFPFNEVNLFDSITTLMNLPILINNTSMMAVFGEYIQNYSHKKHLVYLNVMKHIGIGAGLIINGQLVYGADNYAGEIGSMLYDGDHFDSERTSSIGFLEQNAGIRTLFGQLEDAMNQGRCPILKELLTGDNGQRLTILLLEQAIEAGDRDVMEIYDNVLKKWALLIVNMNLVINPDLFILGGAIAAENSYTIRRLQYFFERGSLFQPRIEASELGDKAPVVGGLHILRKYVFDEILSYKAIER